MPPDGARGVARRGRVLYYGRVFLPPAMRIFLILALLIAVAAVVFALQNPGEMTIHVGPYISTGSTALVLLVTFAIGALVGTLAGIPGRWAAGRRARAAEKRLNAAATAPVSVPVVPPPAARAAPPSEIDPYSARFGPPPHQV